MRLPLVAIVVFLLFGFSSSKQEKRLLGYWEVVRIGKDDKPAQENREKYIIFDKDGSMKGGEIGEEPHRFGSWGIKNEATILYLKTEGGSKREGGDYQILELTRKHMKIKKDSTFIYLEKSKMRKSDVNSKKD